MPQTSTLVASREGIGLDQIADILFTAVICTEFPQELLGSHVSLGKVALHRLVQVLVSHLAVTDLHGFIAVVFDCLLLGSRCRDLPR